MGNTSHGLPIEEFVIPVTGWVRCIVGNVVMLLWTAVQRRSTRWQSTHILTIILTPSPSTVVVSDLTNSCPATRALTSSSSLVRWQAARPASTPPTDLSQVCYVIVFLSNQFRLYQGLLQHMLYFGSCTRSCLAISSLRFEFIDRLWYGIWNSREWWQ